MGVSRRPGRTHRVWGRRCRPDPQAAGETGKRAGTFRSSGRDPRRTPAAPGVRLIRRANLVPTVSQDGDAGREAGGRPHPSPHPAKQPAARPSSAGGRDPEPPPRAPAVSWP